MEPISALLLVAAIHGTRALVQALTGSSDLGSLSADLFKALAESESHINERLSNIEGLLYQMLEQRYDVALSSGQQYLFDVGPATPSTYRVADLERARQSFVEAASAARSPLQKATAERYQLLSVLALGRADLVTGSLSRVESAATIAAFHAAPVAYKAERAAAEELLQRRGERPRRISFTDSKFSEAQLEIEEAAQQAIAWCGRILGEASVLAPAFGLPPRISPPGEPHRPKFFPWIFTVRQGEEIRIGCITAQFLPAPTDVSNEFTVDSTMDLPGMRGEKKDWRMPVVGYLRLRFDPPLPDPFTVRAALSASLSHVHDWENEPYIFPPTVHPINAGTIDIDLPLSGPENRSDIVACADLLCHQDSRIGLIRLRCLKPG